MYETLFHSIYKWLSGFFDFIHSNISGEDETLKIFSISITCKSWTRLENWIHTESINLNKVLKVLNIYDNNNDRSEVQLKSSLNLKQKRVDKKLGEMVKWCKVVYSTDVLNNNDELKMKFIWIDCILCFEFVWNPYSDRLSISVHIYENTIGFLL